MQFLHRSIRLILAISYICLNSNFLYAQMIDWKFYSDAQNNKFYIDRAWNIHIINGQTENHLLVTAQNIEYAYNLAHKYTINHKPSQAISIYKSILGLTNDNNFIATIKGNSAKQLQELRLKNGDRYSILNSRSNIRHFQNGIIKNIIDDDMGYIFKYQGLIDFYRERFRQKKGYKYRSIKMGLSLNNNSGKDFLIFFNSEKFLSSIYSLDEAIENWQNNIGQDIYTRKNIYQDKNSIIYSISATANKIKIYGYERIIFYKNRDYLLRILTVKKDNKTIKKSMLKTIKDFVVVKNGYAKP